MTTAVEYEDVDLWDESPGDVFALFVLEDVPVNMINEVLQKAEDYHDDNCLWLADTYDTLVDISQKGDPGQTLPQVDQQWQSPFNGKSFEDAAEFVQSAPKPPKALNKLYFVVLDKLQYKTEDMLTVCKILDGEVQRMACSSNAISSFLVGHDRHTWEESLMIWQRDGVAAME